MTLDQKETRDIKNTFQVRPLVVVGSINYFHLHFFFVEDPKDSVQYLTMLPSDLNICDFQSRLPCIQQAKNVPQCGPRETCRLLLLVFRTKSRALCCISLLWDHSFLLSLSDTCGYLHVQCFRAEALFPFQGRLSVFLCRIHVLQEMKNNLIQISITMNILLKVGISISSDCYCSIL